MVPALSLLVALAFSLAAEGLLSGRGCGGEHVRGGPVNAPESGAEHLEDTADNPGYDAQDFDDMATDWDAAEAVQEVQPFTVPPAVSPATWSSAPALLHSKTVTALTRGVASAGNRTRNYPVAMRWHYGAHHKSGTVMLKGLAILQADLLKMERCFSGGKYGWRPEGCREDLNDTARVWFWCNFSRSLVERLDRGDYDFKGAAGSTVGDYHAVRSLERQLPGMTRGVHVIRDPIAMVVSGYIYHRKSEDTPLILLPTRNMSRQKALEVEARFVLLRHGREMLHTYLSAPQWLLNVRFESFTESSRSYDATVKAVYQHMLGDVATDEKRQELLWGSVHWDLRRHPPRQEEHVAKDDTREEVTQALNDIPSGYLEKLRELRRLLGYGAR